MRSVTQTDTNFVQWAPAEWCDVSSQTNNILSFGICVWSLPQFCSFRRHRHLTQRKKKTNFERNDGFAKRVIHAVPRSTEQWTGVERRRLIALRITFYVAILHHDARSYTCLRLRFVSHHFHLLFILSFLCAGNSNDRQRYWCIGQRSGVGIASYPCQHHWR